MTKTFMILHICNPIASVEDDCDTNFVGPFYTRKEAAEYLADPRNFVVEYQDPDQEHPEPYVQTAPKGTAQWEDTTRSQLVRRAVRDKDGFVYSCFGDYMRIIELKKR